MPRYNRDDYSACDWKVTKSDILRSKKAIARRRKVRLSSVLGLLAVIVVTVITLDNIIRSVAG